MTGALTPWPGNSQTPAPPGFLSAPILASIRYGLPLAMPARTASARSAGAVDADAVDAGRARHGGEVGIVGRAGLRMLEVGRELAAAEIAALQAADRGIGVVVPDHPDDRHVVFDRGAEHARMHEEGAVADHRDARPVGRRELGAEHAGDAEAHRAEAHRADQRIRALRLAELQQPVVMHADVAHQDRVVGQRAVDLVGGALRIDRRGVVGEARRDQRVPFLAIAVDRARAIACARRLARRCSCGASSSASTWRRNVRTSAISPSATG